MLASSSLEADSVTVLDEGTYAIEDDGGVIGGFGWRRSAGNGGDVAVCDDLAGLKIDFPGATVRGPFSELPAVTDKTLIWDFEHTNTRSCAHSPTPHLLSSLLLNVLSSLQTLLPPDEMC